MYSVCYSPFSWFFFLYHKDGIKGWQTYNKEYSKIKSVNIALFGYGKMGKMVEQIALKRQHQIVAKVDISSEKLLYSEMDLAIDFSTPKAAFGNIKKCLEHNVPVISGTTGWLAKYEEIVAICTKNKGAFLYASNFSLGVNIFFELNRKLAAMMQSQNDYTPYLEEIHHTQKTDAPSGTAISLAEDIIERSKYTGWKLGNAKENEIQIQSKRIDDTPGTHRVVYKSNIDSLEIKHTANNREGFALGAVIAAEWILGKSGVYNMTDVLNLG